MMYALFRDGKQISKAHKVKEVVFAEALEAKAVVNWGTDFPGDHPCYSLAEGYEIKTVSGDGK